MYYIVYETKNLINNNFYIGYHQQVFEPYEFDGYLGSGTIIKSAINKYGVSQFIRTTLFVFQDSESAYKKEKEIIAERINDPFCYNIHEGGLGGFQHINNVPPSQRVNIIALKQTQQDPIVYAELCARNRYRSKLSPTNWKLNSVAQRKASVAGNSPNAITKKKQTYNRIQHQQGQNNSNFGKHVYVDPNNSTEKLRCVKGQQPIGWITTTEMREGELQGKKRWYNNGIKNFLIYSTDKQIVKLNLSLGRIKCIPQILS